MPYLPTFTTGSSLPSATVAGTVAFLGADVTGTAVLLFNAPLFGEEEAETESATIVQTVTGNYTINYVPPGTYWPVAVKDFYITASGELEPNVGGGVGFYDPDVNGMPDSIVVSAGQQVTGIDILLFSLAPVTARHNYPITADSAQSWATDAMLVQLGTQDISLAGEAMLWMYAFYSPTLAAYRAWVTMGTLVMPMEMDELPEDATALPADWSDSDVVADSAEAHGGSDFRAQYPDASIQAFLGNMELPGSQLSSEKPQKASKSFLSHRPRTEFLLTSFPRHEGKPNFSLQKNLGFQSSRAVWGFFYFSETTGQQMFLLFDAVTVEYIEIPQPAETTARFNLATADQAAQTWAADAELILVGTHQSNLRPEGEAEMWFYIYYSASQDSEQVFILSNGMLLAQGPIWEPPSKVKLPDEWLDSDVAIDTAEVHGGSQYRATNQDVWVNGGVARGLLPDQPERAVWQFSYSSRTADPLTIFIDAVTGKVVQPPQPVATTAKFNLDAANQTAQTWAADAELVWAATHQSSLSPEGKAEMWFYAYYSASLDSGHAFFFSNATLLAQMGGDLPYKAALPPQWIDSDTAITTAEAYGGSQYRVTNQDVWVDGGVSYGFLQGQPDRAVWQFHYTSSTADPLTIYIDAVTGEFIEPFKPTTALINLNAANQAAGAWAADAVLVAVGATESLPPSGESVSWAFNYYSATKDSARNFYLINGWVINQEPVPLELVTSQEALPSGWIDSNEAIDTAEVNGGSQFRTNYPDAVVIALLSLNVVEAEPSRAAWKFNYWSTDSLAVMQLFVDALSAEIITGVDSRPQASSVPQSYALHQNYPNPFSTIAGSASGRNPETVIEFQLPTASEVEISIFNLQGQKVATLLRDHQTSGAHKIIWNGTDESGRRVASGVYLYQLRSQIPRVAGLVILCR